MASFDDVLLGSFRGPVRETGQPLDEPGLRASSIPEFEAKESIGDLRERYKSLRGSDIRPEYRGFEVPAGMDQDQTDAWFASIDAREDERERQESLMYRGERALAEGGRYLFGEHSDPEEERRLQEKFGFDPVVGEPEFVKDVRGSTLRQVGLDLIEDPIGTAEKAKVAIDEMAQKAILEDDPESARNLADIASFKDPTGASDLVSAISSARLAYDRPDERYDHLTDTAISGLAAAIPLVGSGFAKQILRGAPDDLSDAAKAAPDAPAPVFEAAAEKLVAGLPDKVGVQALESTLGRKKHPKSGEVVRYTKDVKDKDTGEIIHKKGDKKLTPSGEEIRHPEFIYKDISESEWNDTKFDDFINAAKASGKKSVTKDELIQHLNDNKVQIEEVRLGEQDTPKEIKDLAMVRSQYFDLLEDDANDLFRILAPGKSVSDQMHRFSDNPFYFLNLYIDYVSGLERIKSFENVPPDVQDVVNGVIDLNRNVAISNWMPTDAARITEARNTINAKLADPEYKDFVEQQYIDFSVVPASGVDPDFLKQANRNIEKHQNLSTIARILNEMPEVETRLAALRKFESSEDYKIYVQASRDYEQKYKAFQLDSQKLLPKWKEYTVPGGDDYQEILLTVPVPESSKRAVAIQKYREVADRAREADQRLNVSILRGRDDLTPLEQELVDAYDEAERLPDYGTVHDTSKVFTDSHHSEIPNVMVHIRFKTRIDSRGRKILFVEEIQSDWHQAGRKRGYEGKYILKGEVDQALKKLEDAQKNLLDWMAENPNVSITDQRPELVNLRVKASEAADGLIRQAQKSNLDIGVGSNRMDDSGKIVFDTPMSGEIEVSAIREYSPRYISQGGDEVPDAPLKDTKEWTALAIKRIFREAADGGYDGVAFSRADMITPVVTLPRSEAVALVGKPETFLKRLEEIKEFGGQQAEGAEEAERIFKGNQYYYDTLIPSIAKKESFVPPDRLPDETTKEYQSRVKAARKAKHDIANIGVGEKFDVDGELMQRSIEVPFFELTDKVKDKVIKPQKLYSVALPGIAIGAAAAEEEELSAAAALGAIGLGGMALYKGMKGARAAKLEGLTDLKGNTPKLNDDGTITLYHRTTPEAAAEIRRTGKFVSKENTDEVFFSSKPTGQAEGYGSEVVEVRVDPANVRLDDAFDDEIHVAVKTADVPKPPAPDVATAGAKTAEEQGNPALNDSGSLFSRFSDIDAMMSEFGFSTTSDSRVGIDKPQESGDPMEGGYNQSIDIGPVIEMIHDVTNKRISADRLYSTLLMIEAEYDSLSEDQKQSKRGQMLNDWYLQTADQFAVAEQDYSNTDYQRYLMGSDIYNETRFPGVQRYDDVRAFTVIGAKGPKIVMDIAIRELQENEQRSRLNNTIELGAPLVDMFGEFGSINRYVFNKAKFFKHPVQSVQLTTSEKINLKRNISNVHDLHEAGLISFLLYKELIGDVELL